MAVTPVGNPYVESSDLVANYPGASEALAERIDIVGVNPFANAAARDAAIPSPVQGQMCSLNDDNKGYRYDGSAWILFSGAGDANFTNAATGTFSSGGISYKYITFTGSGELIVDRAGFADVLIVGGGASGGARVGGGGGAGGHLEILNAYLPVGTLTVTVGAGGASVTESANLGKTGLAGSTSRVGSYFSTGGGGGGAGLIANLPQTGGSGGGAASSAAPSGGGAGAAGTTGLGNAGGTGSTTDLGNGGGGGSGAAAANATANNGSIGGAGVSNSFTNTAVTRAGGGGGSGTGTPAAGGSGGGGAGAKGASAATSGTVNTGGGGGGHQDNAASGAGGSGVVIIRVVV